ncbi:MAG: type IX secretion system sortase PorU, partial [Flavobacteriaceae bacterium]|nr:type IX secretion system sortase PorU [Flavobacteriaceae bacterium]
MSVEAVSQLTADATQFEFSNPDVLALSGIGEYVISNATNIEQVWDITDRFNITSKPNDQGATFSFLANMGDERFYQAVATTDLFTPTIEGSPRVNNINIKGTVFQNSQGVFQDIDYLMVTPEFLASETNRLANYHIANGLNVKVVTLEDIYTEFNTGNADIAAIRNLVKYIYDNASAPENRVKYLCIFGDASYDYKDRINGNTNIAPTFHALDSYSLASGFMSDDFFVMMDPDEGALGQDDLMDLAVGRILADSPQQANQMISKILGYYQEEARGRWRNTLVFVSDDADDGDQGLQFGLDALADTIETERPFFNITKIHSDSFVQDSSPGGDRYPRVNQAMRDAIEVGALMVNYFGHGGEDGLAAERIFEKTDSQEINNICRNNLFVTITCEYTRFDNPERPTAGEFNFWNPTGGAVSLVTTTRQIFVSVGQSANQVFSEQLFAYGLSEYPTIAEALAATKNNVSVSANNGKVIFYIGDPAMKLAIAKPDIRLTHVNVMPISGPI